MKSVKILAVALAFGGTILGGTVLKAQTVEPVSAPAFEGASATVPGRPMPERGNFLFWRGDAPRPMPPVFDGPGSVERPEPVWRGRGGRPVFGRRFGHPRWAFPVAHVAETLVPTEQLPE